MQPPFLGVKGVVAAGPSSAAPLLPFMWSRGLLVVSIPIRSQRVLLAIGRLVVEARQVREAIGEFLRHLIARQSGFNRYERPTTSEVLGDPSIAVPVALLGHHRSSHIHGQHSDRTNSPIAASSGPVMIDPDPASAIHVSPAP